MINAILAHDAQYGIGKDGGLPWPKSKADMQWFQKCTSGHVVLMGRTTWESLGCRALPKRTNIVVTNHPEDIVGNPDHILSGSMTDILTAVAQLYPHLHIWIIGGANIYQQALPFCDRLYITEFKGTYDCDTFIDKQDIEPFKMSIYSEEHDGMRIDIKVSK